MANHPLPGTVWVQASPRRSSAGSSSRSTCWRSATSPRGSLILRAKLRTSAQAPTAPGQPRGLRRIYNVFSKPCLLISARAWPMSVDGRSPCPVGSRCLAWPTLVCRRGDGRGGGRGPPHCGLCRGRVAMGAMERAKHVEVASWRLPSSCMRVQTLPRLTGSRRGRRPAGRNGLGLSGP
jgi:hypothetical protein